jgi:hypothetical protein
MTGSPSERRNGSRLLRNRHRLKAVRSNRSAREARFGPIRSVAFDEQPVFDHLLVNELRGLQVACDRLIDLLGDDDSPFLLSECLPFSLTAIV